ncbi:hypothetical protein OV079_41030 [Nannocystis pusilla]|uniref:Uncharacterized protein n=1 Tax=Nannocystis pusilla TaxID=889268 RepID=A0A9X3EYJ9_9BACT|nr:hypothetical protein [Nannocystis pusilla]MCY1011835.1 hypothetical protein [Nannocystis pusilla]
MPREPGLSAAIPVVGFLFEAHAIELGVDAAAREQDVVRSLLDDHAVLQHEDLVGPPDRA